MPRGFTESEKEKIREKLIGACQKRWSRYGYKKTSVEELCRKAGISKGAFYLFFESKEALFCEALCRMQEEIRDGASRIIDERPDHLVCRRPSNLYIAHTMKTIFCGIRTARILPL